MQNSIDQRVTDTFQAEPLRDDMMVQQQVENPWQHMVGVMFLNCTGRKVVKRVLPEFIRRWSTAEEYLESDPEEVSELIKSLGFKNRRQAAIRRMSEDFLTWDGEDATKLFGIGKYGSDSYRLFYKNELPEDVGDHELKRYVEEEFTVDS